MTIEHGLIIEHNTNRTLVQTMKKFFWSNLIKNNDNENNNLTFKVKNGMSPSNFFENQPQLKKGIEKTVERPEWRLFRYLDW